MALKNSEEGKLKNKINELHVSRFFKNEPNTTFIVHGVMLSTWSMWINSKCKEKLLYLFKVKSSNIKIGGVDFFEKIKHFDKIYRLLVVSTLILTIWSLEFYTRVLIQVWMLAILL